MLAWSTIRPKIDAREYLGTVQSIPKARRTAAVSDKSGKTTSAPEAISSSTLNAPPVATPMVFALTSLPPSTSWMVSPMTQVSSGAKVRP